jgi:hypothetical protein
MPDDFAKNRKLNALATTLLMRSPGGPRDPAFPIATGVPQALERRDKAYDRAAGIKTKASPSRMIDKKTKIQSALGY